MDIELLVKDFEAREEAMMAMERRMCDRVEAYTVEEILLEFTREVRYRGTLCKNMMA